MGYFTDINRNAVIITAKQPLVDWVNEATEKINNPHDKQKVTLEEMQRDDFRTIYLIPTADTTEAAKEYLKHIYQGIFRGECSGWVNQEEYWPKEMTWELFSEWFDVEIHSVVIDTADDEPFYED